LTLLASFCFCFCFFNCSSFSLPQFYFIHPLLERNGPANTRHPGHGLCLFYPWVGLGFELGASGLQSRHSTS
jgi:hypothetical protein